MSHYSIYEDVLLPSEEQIFQTERKTAEYFQEVGVEIGQLFSNPEFLPVRIAMDDVENGLTHYMKPTGRIIVHISTKTHFIRTYVGEKLHWEITELNGDNFLEFEDEKNFKLFLKEQA